MTLVPAAPPLDFPDEVDRAAAAAFYHRYPAAGGAPLAVVIAAFDEEDAVGGVVRAIPPVVAGLETEAIVVVDGARDATADRASSAGALVCDVPVNRGQGAALRLGYGLARGRGAQVIATLDADGQWDPGQLGRVVAPVVAGEADFVSGSRRLGSSEGTDSIRQAGVVLFSSLISALIGRRVTDPACGIRAMRAEVTARVTLRQPQYQSSELLITAALAGYRTIEVPITMHRRLAGATKKGGNLLYGARFARVVVGTWRRERRGGRRAAPASAKITIS
ncbi:MAG TPA: glycosyltransferase family 2 protein [Acidimicrobiales bacterium]|nr:glycosyltransferase family 2 protein [Acidimicrobiales bacterium]